MREGQFPQHEKHASEQGGLAAVISAKWFPSLMIYKITLYAYQISPDNFERNQRTYQ